MKTSLSLFCFHLISFKQCNIKMAVCLKKSLKIPMGLLEVLNRRMAKIKRTNNYLQINPTENRGVNSGVPKLPQVKIR
jgi:hypothetical protein